MTKILLSALIAWMIVNSSFAQEVKKMSAVRTDQPPKIDGILDDDVWKSAPVATDFIEFKPTPGQHEKDANKTEIKILYDNSAIYVAARMYDDHPDSIARELTTRDRIGNTDFVGIIIDTYLDRINALGFYVTPSGTQFDAKYSQGGNEDGNWNAVWESEVKIDKSGWTAEFKIPYSALRFDKGNTQTWGINITRRRQMTNQQLFWNNINPKLNGFINQEGELNGIENIKAPVRLSFAPYLSSYVNNYPHNQVGVKNTTDSFNGGMDVKYGINQSFTLDMTLVPDFGQVQSDNQVLNLSPFEVRFNENRGFFTEGTELFGKGDLFYSRRIGSFPKYIKSIDNLKANETIASNPSESKLINATKISGRTASGLGIGVFNGITNRINAVITDNLGNTRLVETQPLTNYNILVFDQSLKNNSSATIINTNVLRQGSAYDANVSAFLFNLNDKKNKYNLNGSLKVSHLTADGSGKAESTGLNYQLSTGKRSGTFTWGYTQTLTDDKFDPTDMGFANNNNFFTHSVDAGYRIYKPGKWYNQINDFFNAFYSERYIPRSFQFFKLWNGGNIQFKNFLTLGYDIAWTSAGNDFYEARATGRVYNMPSQINPGVFVNTNSTKRYSIQANTYITLKNRFGGFTLSPVFNQYFRVNNHFSIGTNLWVSQDHNLAGWLGANPSDQIIFSRYDRNTVDNSINANYTFNNKMGITLRARHYWSDRRNKEFYILLNNGDLSHYTGHDFDNKNENYNVFNIDMVYSWEFAPGSQFLITYKNASSINEDFILAGYGKNFRNTIESPQNNNLSVKISYYLDYLQLRKKGK